MSTGSGLVANLTETKTNAIDLKIRTINSKISRSQKESMDEKSVLVIRGHQAPPSDVTEGDLKSQTDGLSPTDARKSISNRILLKS